MKTHPTHHTVHAFAVVRVRVPDIMARSHAEAIADAEERLDYAGLFNDERAGIEWAEEVSHYLVDEADDPKHTRSCFYAPDGHTPLVDGQVPVRLVVEMNGGRIQELQAERPGVQVLLIDHATGDITGPTILNDPAGRPVYQSLETAEVAPEAVAGWWQNYERQQPLDRDAALDAVRLLLAMPTTRTTCSSTSSASFAAAPTYRQQPDFYIQFERSYLLRSSVWTIAALASWTVIRSWISTARAAPGRVRTILFSLFIKVHRFRHVLRRGVDASIHL